MITEPMPSMPIRLWGDDDGARYRASYFETFPGIWRHGDWIEITDRGTAIITGRSDATINRGGIRMGTAEIYRAVLALDEVVDALVVDLPREGTAGLHAAVRRPPRRSRRSTTSSSAGSAPGSARTARRVTCPTRCEQCPRCRARSPGKVLEVPVKRILSGEPADTALEPRLARRSRGTSTVRGARSFGRLARHMTYAAASDRYERMPYRRTGRQRPAAARDLARPVEQLRRTTARSRRAARSCGGPSTSGSRTSTSRTTTARRTARPRRPSGACSRRISRRTATSS